MCKRYYDIRTFGAVLTTGENAGQVRGPVQLTFSRSIDPIVTLEHTITRCAPAKEVENPNPEDSEEEKAKKERGRMGRKFTVPYGLYRCHGSFPPTSPSKPAFPKTFRAVLAGTRQYVRPRPFRRTRTNERTRALCV